MSARIGRFFSPSAALVALGIFVAGLLVGGYAVYLVVDEARISIGGFVLAGALVLGAAGALARAFPRGCNACRTTLAGVGASFPVELVTAGSGGDAFVASYDDQGGLRWKKIIRGSSIGPGVSVAVAKNGDVVLAGAFQQGLSLGGATLQSAGIDDIFVAKLDAAGHHLWSKRFGTPSQDFAGPLAVGPGGAIFVSASVSDVVDLGAGPIPGPAGQPHTLAAVFEADGTLRFSTDADALVNDPDALYLSSAAFDASGNVVINLDYSLSSPDFILMKLNAGGHPIWSESFGPYDVTAQATLTTTPSGGVLLTAQLQNALDLGNIHLAGPKSGAEVLIAKFAP
ncbi:Hypothetical protein A7982_04060 [Minicystis rosea]|nr:Hypothetical protein A7982_04060 [Minicystis rosea]